MDGRLIDVTKQTVINSLVTCDVDHNNEFVKGPLSNALNTLLLSIMEDSFGIRESFEEAILQAATALNTLAGTAAAIANDAAMMALIRKFAAETVKK